jgi:hypothetical protein
MYGNGGSGLVMASASPLSIGAAFTIGWWAMALVTLFFLFAASYQLVRPGNKLRP